MEGFYQSEIKMKFVLIIAEKLKIGALKLAAYAKENSEKAFILSAWYIMLPLSLWMTFIPLLVVAHELMEHNTLLLSYPLFMTSIAGMLGLRMFWLIRNGWDYYRDHYGKK
ncbi:MAG: hypothetical protein WC878_05310 [Candidatus Paceibacterota bacterium]